MVAFLGWVNQTKVKKLASKHADTSICAVFLLKFVRFENENCLAQFAEIHQRLKGGENYCSRFQ